MYSFGAIIFLVLAIICACRSISYYAIFAFVLLGFLLQIMQLIKDSIDVKKNIYIMLDIINKNLCKYFTYKTNDIYDDNEDDQNDK